MDTVRYLKPKQILYQVYYRLNRVKALSAYTCNKPFNTINYLHFWNYLPVFKYADLNNNFVFINQEVKFTENIDWGYFKNGQLWHLNLHYANYLLQEDISLNKRLIWLSDLHSFLYKKKGVLEPYAVSIRTINTIRLLSRHQVKDVKILVALRAELHFLSTRIEFNLLGNHILENAFALLMGGVFFNNNNWIRKGSGILERESKEQILRDGAHFELSPMYHQIILHRILEFIDWYGSYAKRDEKLLGQICNKATKMISWAKNITFNNNSIPHLNDCAPGIAYDTKSLLGYASCLGLDTSFHIPLSDSGYRKYKMINYECIVDVGNIGPAYQAGHGHADALSFVLNYNNAPAFVDTGISTYEIGPVRNFERSSAAHNTVVVNNTSQSRIWGRFRVGERAKVKIICESKNKIGAEHNGYLKKYGITHSRAFEFKNNNLLIIDKLNGANKLDGVAYFHLHPSIEIEISKNAVQLIGVGSIKFINAIQVNISVYSFAEEYNKVVPSKALKVHFKNFLETYIDFVV